MVQKMAALAALAALAVTAPACASTDVGDEATRRDEAALSAFPRSFSLPDGFRPEGIEIDVAHATAYVGSLVSGAIHRADLITGERAILSAGLGTHSFGLKIDFHQRLFVAGGRDGDARIFDARNGNVLKTYALATAPTLVNDVVLTPRAAWFTDSLTPVLYKLPLGPRGELPREDEIVRVPLTGDIVYTTPGNNANGIVTTPDRSAFIVVQSNTGKLFRVDPSGVTREVDLGGEIMTYGDGLLREGLKLYVVQNRLSQVAVIDLDGAGTRGKVVAHLTDPALDVPTTVAAFGPRLYLPNARLVSTPTTPYNVVAIDKW